MAQGYLYYDTIISHSGINNGDSRLTYIKAMEYNGKLCFWWPRISYWNSFEVHVRDAGGNGRNTVTSVSNSAEPSATKKVQTNLKQSWDSSIFATGSDTRSFGTLQIGGTTVIDSSRNATFVNATIGDKLTLSNTARVDLEFNKTGSASHYIRKDGEYLRFRGGNDTTVIMEMRNNAQSNVCSFPSGRLGVGTTDPSESFHSTGTIRGNAFKVNDTTVIDSSRNLNNIGSINCSDTITTTKSYYTAISMPNAGAICRGGTTTATSDLGLYSYVSGHWIRIVSNDAPINFFSDGGVGGRGTTINVSFDTSGNITARGNITAYSDERLKDNVETLDGSKVYQMRGVSFSKDGELGSGVIAQELEQVAPELVMTNDDEMQTKSVAYGNVVGYLIEAIKELKQEIEELKNVNSN